MERFPFFDTGKKNPKLLLAFLIALFFFKNLSKNHHQNPLTGITITLKSPSKLRKEIILLGQCED